MAPTIRTAALACHTKRPSIALNAASPIPHFYNSPYYVYQYATCFASSAKLVQGIQSKDAKVRKEATDKYLTLLKSGGNDYPMEQLKKAGVDLSKPETIKAVVDQLDALVNQYELELKKLKT